MDVNIISLLVSITSLLAACITLYLSILKRGKPKIIVFLKPNEISFNKASRHKEVNTFVIFTIPVVLKNTGAKSVAVKDIKWSVTELKYMKSNIISRPNFENNGLSILPPYEQLISNLQISFELIGHGQGFKDPTYIESLNNVKESILQGKTYLNIEYRTIKRNNFVRRVRNYNIQELLIDGITRTE
ncbi:hypothetical protein [Paenibacillus xylanexedens]|uniref:hypothetical protein n=1 Tax=Paenibacillus xylanexedens TaxID=528191 RepID=UPI00119D994D|nr:hypothetical protein [Paenibacillus xylanexedens]